MLKPSAFKTMLLTNPASFGQSKLLVDQPFSGSLTVQNRHEATADKFPLVSGFRPMDKPWDSRGVLRNHSDIIVAPTRGQTNQFHTTSQRNAEN